MAYPLRAEFKNSRMRNAVSRRFTLCAVESCFRNATVKAPDLKRLCRGHSQEWGAVDIPWWYGNAIPTAEVFALWCGRIARGHRA